MQMPVGLLVYYRSSGTSSLQDCRSWMFILHCVQEKNNRLLMIFEYNLTIIIKYH